jgi:peptidase E
MVCGPTLAPTRLTSPFTAPTDLNLDGLGLVPQLVLPHHGRPQRNAAHRDAAMTFGSTVTLTTLWDDEVLLIDESHWTIARAAV